MLRFKKVMRWEGSLFRAVRVMWDRGTVGDGQGYSTKVSLGFWPVLWQFNREWNGWFVTVLGVRIHFQRSFGGRFV